MSFSWSSSEILCSCCQHGRVLTTTGRHEGTDAPPAASPLQSVTWPEPVLARCNLTPHNSCNSVIVTQDRLGPDLTASFNYNKIKCNFHHQWLYQLLYQWLMTNACDIVEKITSSKLNFHSILKIISCVMMVIKIINLPTQYSYLV